MTAILEKPPISKMALLFVVLGVAACFPAFQASLIVGAMGGGFTFLLFSFIPIFVFAVFAITIANFDKLHWSITKGYDRKQAGWSKIAIFGYVFFAISLIPLVSYIDGFQANFSRGVSVYSISYALIKEGGNVTLSVAFLIMAHIAQKVQEMTFAFAKSESVRDA